MFAIIVTVIAGFLMKYDVITGDWFVCLILGSIILEWVSIALYHACGWLKHFYHDVLAWHTPAESTRWYDGLSDNAVCKHCGKKILQDSQGNWFTFGE